MKEPPVLVLGLVWCFAFIVVVVTLVWAIVFPAPLPAPVTLAPPSKPGITMTFEGRHVTTTDTKTLERVVDPETCPRCARELATDQPNDGRISIRDDNDEEVFRGCWRCLVSTLRAARQP